MVTQLSILDAIESQKGADNGLELALETAEKEFPGWKDVCWKLFLQWLRCQTRFKEFKIEDFRHHVEVMGLIEMPRSKRAFGFIPKRAMKENLIQCVGTAKVANKNAHSANAGLYIKP